MDIFLNYLDSAITLITIVLLGAAVSRKFSSTTIALIVMTMVQAVSYIMTGPVIEDLSRHDRELARIVHYFGYAFIDMLAISVCLRIHKMLNMVISFFSKAVIFCYGFVAFLQIARYFDRSANLDVLGGFYHHAIPLINILLVSLALYFVISEFRDAKMRSNLKGFMNDL